MRYGLILLAIIGATLIYTTGSIPPQPTWPNTASTITISVEIGPTENDPNAIGWLEMFYHALGQKLFAPNTPFLPPSPPEGYTRVCGLVIFPTADGSQYYQYDWQWSQKTGYTVNDAGGELRVVINDTVAKNIFADVQERIVDRNKARQERRTKGLKLYFNRHAVRSSCNTWIGKGIVELPIFLFEYPDEKASSPGNWYELVEKNVIRQFVTAKETVGMVIITNRYDLHLPLRVIAYDLDRPSQPAFEVTSVIEPQRNASEIASLTVANISQSITKWLGKCNYARYIDRCYPRGEACKPRYMLAAPANQSAETRKYCLRDVSYYFGPCPKEDCEETCKLLTAWTECNSTCGKGFRKLQVMPNREASKYRMSSWMRSCPGVNQVESCVTSCGLPAWAIAAAASGIILLLLLIAAPLAVYWFLFRTPATRLRRKSTMKRASTMPKS